MNSYAEGLPREEDVRLAAALQETRRLREQPHAALGGPVAHELPAKRHARGGDGVANAIEVVDADARDDAHPRERRDLRLEVRGRVERHAVDHGADALRGRGVAVAGGVESQDRDLRVR